MSELTNREVNQSWSSAVMMNYLQLTQLASANRSLRRSRNRLGVNFILFYNAMCAGDVQISIVREIHINIEMHNGAGDGAFWFAYTNVGCWLRSVLRPVLTLLLGRSCSPSCRQITVMHILS